MTERNIKQWVGANQTMRPKTTDYFVAFFQNQFIIHLHVSLFSCGNFHWYVFICTKSCIFDCQKFVIILQY